MVVLTSPTNNISSLVIPENSHGRLRISAHNGILIIHLLAIRGTSEYFVASMSQRVNDPPFDLDIEQIDADI